MHDENTHREPDEREESKVHYEYKNRLEKINKLYK